MHALTRLFAQLASYDGEVACLGAIFRVSAGIVCEWSVTLRYSRDVCLAMKTGVCRASLLLVDSVQIVALRRRDQQVCVL